MSTAAQAQEVTSALRASCHPSWGLSSASGQSSRKDVSPDLERLGRVRADQAARGGFSQTFQVAGSYRNKQIDRS